MSSGTRMPLRDILIVPPPSDQSSGCRTPQAGQISAFALMRLPHSTQCAFEGCTGLVRLALGVAVAVLPAMRRTRDRSEDRRSTCRPIPKEHVSLRSTDYRQRGVCSCSLP
jgi:hypothetical protein